MAIYNVAILSLVIGPVVTLLIRSQANANFAFVAMTGMSLEKWKLISLFFQSSFVLISA